MEKLVQENQYKIVAPNKGTAVLFLLLNLYQQC